MNKNIVVQKLYYLTIRNKNIVGKIGWLSGPSVLGQSLFKRIVLGQSLFSRVIPSTRDAACYSRNP